MKVGTAIGASFMSSELDNTDQLKVFYDDSVANRLVFLPPDVNHSFYRFVPVDRSHIRYALGAVKGSGESAVDHIVKVRTESGPFTDLFDFCRRTDKKIVNKRTIEAWIRAGAFDAIEPNRARLIANVSLCMDAAEQEAANINQGGLFDMMLDGAAPKVRKIAMSACLSVTTITSIDTRLNAATATISVRIIVIMRFSICTARK